MKKAFLVIMSFVVTLSFPAYAGVVSGVRPPDTTKNETKTDTSTKQDTSSKQNVADQSAKQDTTVKQNETQSQNQSDSSWLFPNGIAKAPSYLDTKIVHEGKDLDDSSNLYLAEKYRSDPAFAPGRSGLWFYWTEYRKGNFTYPDINPATGKPLWDTQPFWREDGSFDLYGYLKQFAPRYDGELANISIDWKSDNRTNQKNRGSMIDLRFNHKDDNDLTKLDEIKPFLGLEINLANYPYFSADVQREIGNDPSTHEVIAMRYKETFPVGNGRFCYVTVQSRLHPYALGSKVRITGTNDIYIYEPEIRQLEAIFKTRLSDDPEFQKVNTSYDDKTGLWFTRGSYSSNSDPVQIMGGSGAYN